MAFFPILSQAYFKAIMRAVFFCVKDFWLQGALTCGSILLFGWGCRPQVPKEPALSIEKSNAAVDAVTLISLAKQVKAVFAVLDLSASPENTEKSLVLLEQLETAYSALEKNHAQFQQSDLLRDYVQAAQGILADVHRKVKMHYFSGAKESLLRLIPIQNEINAFQPK